MIYLFIIRLFNHQDVTWAMVWVVLCIHCWFFYCYYYHHSLVYSLRCKWCCLFICWCVFWVFYLFVYCLRILFFSSLWYVGLWSMYCCQCFFFYLFYLSICFLFFFLSFLLLVRLIPVDFDNTRTLSVVNVDYPWVILSNYSYFHRY